MEVPQAAYSRDKIIIRTGAIGIISNVILAAFKGVVGLISGSIAIVLDAVNNLSDALSSVITIVGVHLASKQPDRAHRHHPLHWRRLARRIDQKDHSSAGGEL